MREDGWLIGYGMATPCTTCLRWSASARRYPPRSGPGHVCWPEALIVPEITSIVRRRSPAGAATRGEDPLKQEGAPVQVPITVEPPAGRFTACVVNT